MVTMRIGGISTSGFKSRRTIMKEHLKAFKKHNIPEEILEELVEELIDKGHLDDEDFVKRKFKA